MDAIIEEKAYRPYDPRLSTADCIIFDPPYDRGFYEQIPKMAAGNKSLIVFSSTRYMDIPIKIAPQRGWKYRFSVVWDTVSSWYIPGVPLVRDNIVLVFGSFKYNKDAAIVNDGVIRNEVITKNGRGEYHATAKDYCTLSSVYKKMRSTMNKVHTHQKPVPLCAAIMGGVGAKKVFDPFCGSGAIGVAAQYAGANLYIGQDKDPECVKMARTMLFDKHKQVESQYDLFLTNDE